MHISCFAVAEQRFDNNLETVFIYLCSCNGFVLCTMNFVRFLLIFQLLVMTLVPFDSTQVISPATYTTHYTVL